MTREEDLIAANNELLRQLKGTGEQVKQLREINTQMAIEIRGYNGKVRREMDAHLKGYRKQIEQLLPLASRYVLLRQFPVMAWKLRIFGASGEVLDQLLDDAAQHMEAARAPGKGSDG